jgi:uncharacterized integral membrane protein
VAILPRYLSFFPIIVIAFTVQTLRSVVVAILPWDLGFFPVIVIALAIQSMSSVIVAVSTT